MVKGWRRGRGRGRGHAAYIHDELAMHAEDDGGEKRQYSKTRPVRVTVCQAGV